MDACFRNGAAERRRSSRFYSRGWSVDMKANLVRLAIMGSAAGVLFGGGCLGAISDNVLAQWIIFLGGIFVVGPQVGINIGT